MTFKFRTEINKPKRLVVKIGSSVIADDSGNLDLDKLKSISDDISELKSEGVEVVIVSSGAILAGSKSLKGDRKDVRYLQALSAIGQPELVNQYSNFFSQHNIKTAQILLTHDTFRHPKSLNNVKNTISCLLENSIVPILNENDSVSYEEITLGDNDNLAVLTSELINADLLLILSSADGLFTDDPSSDDAKAISLVNPSDKLEAIKVSSISSTGRGGMKSKLSSARKASSIGINTIVAGKDFSNPVNRALTKSVGTFFVASASDIKKETSAQDVAKNAKIAARELLTISKEQRNNALKNISSAITANKEKIIRENLKDIKYAESNNFSKALVDRLLLTEDRIEAMADGVSNIEAQDEVIGNTVSESKRPDGLTICKEQVALGVILMIFESRPNVVVDCAALAIKSGNAIILKGGKEAYYSNLILSEIINEAIDKILPNNTIQTLASNDRSLVQNLLSQNEYIDVVIPRGGEGLVNYVYQNSKIPVIAHFKGLCHVYIDETANQAKAQEVCINAKTQRPGVCNAMETLLINKNIDDSFIINLCTSLKELNTELIADEYLCSKFSDLDLSIASDSDWSTEYLSNKLSIKSVESLDEAISHINQFGSNHTEAIICEDDQKAQKFKDSIDASCIMINASTRFNDGGELGLGAEIGISTTKLHAYGPMGASELTTKRYVVVGDGHTRK